MWLWFAILVSLVIDVGVARKRLLLGFFFFFFFFFIGLMYVRMMLCVGETQGKFRIWAVWKSDHGCS